jgi:hypothetical protein
MSKILKDFQKRRNSPTGDLINLQRNRVIGNWPNFKYCIQNKLPIYSLADTQSGKTFFKVREAEGGTVGFRNGNGPVVD